MPTMFSNNSMIRMRRINSLIKSKNRWNTSFVSKFNNTHKQRLLIREYSHLSKLKSKKSKKKERNRWKRKKLIGLLMKYCSEIQHQNR